MTTYFAPGQWNFHCDLCGRKGKSGNARKTWDGFYVCAHHKEERNPQDFVRGVKGEAPIPWRRVLSEPSYPIPAPVISYSSAILATNADGSDALVEVNGELWWASSINTIERYNSASGAHLGTITLSHSAYTPLIKDTAGGCVWGWNSYWSTMWCIDMTTLVVTTFTSISDMSYGLHYDETNGTLWKQQTNVMRKLNKTTLAVEATVTLAATAFDVVFDAAGDIWYTLGTTSKTLYQTTQAGVTTTWELAEADYGLAFITYDPVRNSLWVSTGGSTNGQVLQFAIASKTVVTILDALAPGTGSNYPDLVYADGYVYQNNPTNDAFRVIDAASGALVFDGTVAAEFYYLSMPVPYAGNAYTLAYDADYISHLIKWTLVLS